MTDLQVKYQSLMEEKRLHDAQIDKAKAETSKAVAETAYTNVSSDKVRKEIEKLAKDIQWYDAKASAEIAEKVASTADKATHAWKNVMGAVDVASLFAL